MPNPNSRIETKFEVDSYLANLRHSLDNGAKITFQIERQVDDRRDAKFTNRYTVAELFPDENPTEALKRELKTLTV